MESSKQWVVKLLRWTEKYTKTDMVYLAKGSFWLNLATGLNWIILLVLLYAFGNYVEPEVYGMYRYFLSVYGIITFSSLAGFNGALTRSVAQGNEGELFRIFKIQTLGSLVGTLGAFIVSAYYFWNANSVLGTGFIIMGLALPLMESLDLYGAFFSGKKEFRLISLASVVTQLGTTIALIIAIALHGTVMPLLATYFISWILLKSYFFARALRIRKNLKIGSDTISTGINFSVTGALSSVSSYLDRIVLFHYMGAKDVALYSFAIAPTEQLKGLFKNTSALIFPKFSTRTEEEIRTTILHKTLLMGASSLAVAAVYIIAAPFIISFFLPKYTEIILHSQVYALSLVGVMIIPLNSAMSAIPKIKALYLTNTVSPIVNIILMFLLIPAYGLWGAIAAKALGRVISVILTYLFYLAF